MKKEEEERERSRSPWSRKRERRALSREGGDLVIRARQKRVQKRQATPARGCGGWRNYEVAGKEPQLVAGCRPESKHARFRGSRVTTRDPRDRVIARDEFARVAYRADRRCRTRGRSTRAIVVSTRRSVRQGLVGSRRIHATVHGTP